MRTWKFSLVIGATLLGLGCGGTAVPTQKLTAAEASMRAAEEIGAKSVPKAELHLKLAQEQVEQARQLSDDGDNQRAAQLLSRAKADADLAIALAKDAAAKQDLKRANAQLQEVSKQSPQAEMPAEATVSSAQ